MAIATADILPQVHRIEQRNPMTLVFLAVGLGQLDRNALGGVAGTTDYKREIT
jgi:hypothetical protein